MKIQIAKALVIGVVAVGWYTVLRAQQPMRSVWDGVYTKEQVSHGQVLYNQSCSTCHGQGLEGVEMAPALAGGEFLDKWASLTVGDLFERIRTSMPADKPGRLSREVYADITAYMLSANQFPSGETELSPDTQVLKQIRIDAVKPK